MHSAHTQQIRRKVATDILFVVVVNAIEYSLVLLIFQANFNVASYRTDHQQFHNIRSFFIHFCTIST